MLAHILLPLAVAAGVLGQNRPAPKLNPNPKDTNNPRLVGKRFEFNEIPLKVDTTSGERGQQTGYNQCNSTTAGPTSLCQTLIVNSIDDFCLFGPPTRKVVGDAEAEMVTWCTKPTHGARLIPPNALSAVQFIVTPSYVEVTGRLNQELINIPRGDYGGELDSGGQDLRGNPIGALTYSTALPNTKGKIKQSPVWHYFVGADTFCMKLCDGKAPNAMGLCEHIYDTYGCGVNVPSAMKPHVFEACEGDDQLPVKPGVTDIPASRKCTQYQSSELYNGKGPATGTPVPDTAAPPPTPTPSVSGSISQSAPHPGVTPSGSASGSPTRPPAGGSPTGTPTPSSTKPPGGAAGTRASTSGLVGLLLSAFLGLAVVA